MTMTVGTLGRYIAWRFCAAFISVFVGMMLLIVLIDYIEMTRRSSSIANISAWTVALTSFFRVPQITERLMPFSVLVGAMSAYLNLSRRNELVIARAAGISAWQFVAPAVVAAMAIGIVAVLAYNPMAALMAEQAKRLEEGIFGPRGGQRIGYWARQRSDEGQSILYAANSRNQGESLTGISVFMYDPKGTFTGRIEAESARLEPGRWRLANARVHMMSSPPQTVSDYPLLTNLTRAQVSESFATPETVSFWRLPSYIELAEGAGVGAAGYRLQLQLLLARPFLLAGMVLLAAAVSLRFFRAGGVSRMVLGGVAAGFLLYVLSKVTEDLSKAQLMHSVTAAWVPVIAGAMTGIVTLLFQEDG
jgi:lipopolysaccharide export system permease protein